MSSKYLIAAVLVCCPALAAEEETQQERIDRLRALPTAEKEELAGKLERYQALSNEQRSRVHKLYDHLDVHPKKDELMTVMHNYHDWLKTLTSRQLTELRQMTEDKRIEYIKQVLRDQQQQRQWKSWLKIAHEASPDDLDTVYEWMRNFVETHRGQILESMPREFGQRIANIDDRDRQSMVMIYLLLWQRYYVPGSARPSQEDVDELVARLSPDAQNLFNKADQSHRLQLLFIWMRTALWSKSFPNVSSIQLAEFYGNMPADERDRLDKLSPQERELELRSAYSRANFFRAGELGERSPFDPLSGKLRDPREPVGNNKK